MATFTSEGNYIHLESETSIEHPYKVDAWILKDDISIELRKNKDKRTEEVYIGAQGKNYYFQKDEFTNPDGSSYGTIEELIVVLKDLVIHYLVW